MLVWFHSTPPEKATSLVSYCDSYRPLAIAKERPELFFGLDDDGNAKGDIINQLEGMHSIVETHPGPIPADVQTALFLAM